MRTSKIIYLFLIIFFLLLINECYYRITLRNITIKNEKIYLRNINQNKKTPKIVMQSIWDKRLIPQKVYDSIKKYCPGYKHIVYDDNECIKFLEDNYGEEIKNKFLSLKRGAHKADLFRYCWLYKMGGVWIDIKMVLLKNINSIFSDDEKLYSVVTKKDGWEKLAFDLINTGTAFQGLIASPPNNEIFKKLINKVMVTTDFKLDMNYHLFTMHFYNEMIKLNKDKYHVFSEECSKENNKDLADRYGLNCSIYDNNRDKIFLTRYTDYPWKEIKNEK